MRLKFLCPDTEVSDEQMTLDELHLEDANRFKEIVKQQFVDYRSKFRNIMNQIRAQHYDSFVQLGMEKESSRLAADGKDKSGNKIYDSIKDELKGMRERLKAAGVNRIIAGINDEEEYDSEEDEGTKDKDEEVQQVTSPEKAKQPEASASAEQPLHVPRVIGGGIPRPAPAQNNFMKQSQPELDVGSMRGTGRDFRINANSSRTSFGNMSLGGESNTAKPVNRLPKQRPHLIGANKPHMLKNQNDQLR